MKTYVINMERSVHRRSSIEQHLKEIGIDYRIVTAVDGSTLPDNYPQNPFENERPFSKSEIGCLLSHCKIYSAMQNDEDEFALILEDDVLLSDPAMPDMIAQIEKAASKDTVTLLTYFGTKNGQIKLYKIKQQDTIRGKNSNYTICTPGSASELTRAGAYIVSKTTALNILKFHDPQIRCRADHWELYDREGVISGLHCLYPMPVTENYDHGSEINYTRNAFEAFSKKVVAWIIYNDIPVLAYLLKKRRQQYSGLYKNIVLDKETK